MLKRTAFRRHAPAVPREDRPAAPFRRVERSANFAGAVSGVAVQKGPKAKPGKGKPNAEERRWMDAIVAHGCIACRMDGLGIVAPAVHHILRGGRRMGHLFTLPLCPGHHQDGYGAPGMIARHPTKARFEARYGDEWALLALLKSEIGVTA